MNHQEFRQVLDCGSILPLSFGPRTFPKRQNTAAVHDAVALNATPFGFVVPFHAQKRNDLHDALSKGPIRK